MDGSGKYSEPSIRNAHICIEWHIVRDGDFRVWEIVNQPGFYVEPGIVHDGDVRKTKSLPLRGPLTVHKATGGHGFPNVTIMNISFNIIKKKPTFWVSLLSLFGLILYSGCTVWNVNEIS